MVTAGHFRCFPWILDVVGEKRRVEVLVPRATVRTASRSNPEVHRDCVLVRRKGVDRMDARLRPSAAETSRLAWSDEARFPETTTQRPSNQMLERMDEVGR